MGKNLPYFLDGDALRDRAVSYLQSLRLHRQLTKCAQETGLKRGTLYVYAMRKRKPELNAVMKILAHQQEHAHEV